MTARVRSGTLLAYALFAFVAVSALGAGRARAEDVNAAREHYKKGTTYYDLGKYADAAKEFEAAYEAKNDPAILFNLAQAYRLAGDPDQALHFYRTYLRYVPKAANRVEIEEQIKALEQKVATKTPTTTTTAPPPATAPPPPPPPVAVTAPPPLPVPGPGGPAVVTTAPFAPPMASDVAPQPGPVLPDPGSRYRIAGIVTAGAGAAMILVGIAEGARAHSAANQIEDDAKAGNPFDPAVQSRGKSAEKAQWWLLGLGAVAGAAGGALWYYGHHLTAEARAAGTVSFAPVVGPGQGGAFMRVTF